MHPLIILSAIWVGFELVISFMLRSDKAKAVSFDRSSILIIWIVLIISVTAAVFESIHFGYPSTFRLYYYCGMCIIIIGMILRITAILSLRKRFTTNIAIQEDHSLKTDGLYKWLRHPSYTGTLISFTGLGISFGNWLSLVTLIVPITAIFIYRIRLEEEMLLKHFGKDYEEYRKKSKRLIPFIY